MCNWVNSWLCGVYMWCEYDCVDEDQLVWIFDFELIVDFFFEECEMMEFVVCFFEEIFDEVCEVFVFYY